jgi:IS30 family transposase
MSNFDEIELGTNLAIYFAHPYHSWERGTNENTNGLLRLYFPKKMSFAHLTKDKLEQTIKKDPNNKGREELFMQLRSIWLGMRDSNPRC